MSADEKRMILVQWELFLKKLLVADMSKTVGSDYGYFPADLQRAWTTTAPPWWRS
jgi:hypothetical protein